MTESRHKKIAGDGYIPCEEKESIDQIPPRYQDLYSQICLLEKLDSIFQFFKTNYIVSIFVRPTAVSMHPVD